MERLFNLPPWSFEVASGWRAELRVLSPESEPHDCVEVIAPTGDATLSFTPCRLPAGGFKNAEQWIESTASSNRQRGRPISPGHWGDFSGHTTHFVAGSELLRGWSLRSGSFALDVCYRCPVTNDGRDERAVNSMVHSLRFDVAVNSHAAQVRITGWKPSAKLTSINKAIHQYTNHGYIEAQARFESALSGKVVVLNVATIERALLLVEALINSGAYAELVGWGFPDCSTDSRENDDSAKFKLPSGLAQLIEKGIWPSFAGPSMTAQDRQPIVAAERIRLFAPEESRICLQPPPFSTIADERAKSGAIFWDQFAAPDQITPDLALIIGDFGIGSDSPVILDFAKDAIDPPVLRLQWGKRGKGNAWVQGAKNFDEFATMLGFNHQ